jgi:deoxyribonuclease-4
MQIFTKSPRTWDAKSIDPTTASAFHEACKAASLPVFAHGSYLANPASSDPVQIEKSIASLSTELLRCEVLHIPYLVLHCGHGQDDTQRSASFRVVSCLTEAYTRVLAHPVHDHNHSVMVLLENSAGGKTSVGNMFEDIAEIIDNISDSGFSRHIGACFDTCHAYAAGYALRTEDDVHSTCDALFSIISPHYLRLIHLNDAQYACGSGRDRHLPPGKGHIGVLGFSALLHHPLIRDIPLICEVPISDQMSGQELIRSVKDIGKAMLES